MAIPEVREARSADIEELAKFEAEIAAISFGEDAVTDARQHVKKIERALIKGDDIMLVLVMGDEMGGVVAGWLWITVNTNMFTGEKYANFRSFALKPEVRGGESSRSLFSEGLKRLKRIGDIARVVGKVHVSNLPMRILYKELGFEPQHLTMELRLK